MLTMVNKKDVHGFSFVLYSQSNRDEIKTIEPARSIRPRKLYEQKSNERLAMYLAHTIFLKSFSRGTAIPLGIGSERPVIASQLGARSRQGRALSIGADRGNAPWQSRLT